MGVSALAKVLTGWTGSFAIDDGTNPAYEIVPFTRDSVASFVARIVHELRVRSGVTGVVSVDGSGVITITLDASITYEASGLVGDYTGTSDATDSVIQGVDTYTGCYIPAYGMRLGDPLVATTRGQPTTYGATSTSGVRRSGRSTLTIWPDHMSAPSFENYDWDLWHDGRLQGRFRVAEVRRVPLSRYLRGNESTRLDCDVEEVA